MRIRTLVINFQQSLKESDDLEEFQSKLNKYMSHLDSIEGRVLDTIVLPGCETKQTTFCIIYEEIVKPEVEGWNLK